MSVYWITGLSGAGKTTIGYEYYLYRKSLGDSIVFLDGDSLRLVMGVECGYELSERKKLAYKYARLSKMLAVSGESLAFSCFSVSNAVFASGESNSYFCFATFLELITNSLYSLISSKTSFGHVDI